MNALSEVVFEENIFSDSQDEVVEKLLSLPTNSAFELVQSAIFQTDSIDGLEELPSGAILNDCLFAPVIKNAQILSFSSRAEDSPEYASIEGNSLVFIVRTLVPQGVEAVRRHWRDLQSTAYSFEDKSSYSHREFGEKLRISIYSKILGNLQSEEEYEEARFLEMAEARLADDLASE